MSKLSEYLKSPPRKDGIGLRFDNDADARNEVFNIMKSLIISAVLENADPAAVIESALVIGFELGYMWHEIEQLETQLEQDIDNNVLALSKDKLAMLQNMAMVLANLQESRAVVDSADELLSGWSNSELMGLFRLSRKLIKARNVADS